MAIIFSCTGGLLGLLSALAALAGGAGVLTALALWSGAGIVFTLLGLTLVLLPRHAPDDQRQTA